MGNDFAGEIDRDRSQLNQGQPEGICRRDRGKKIEEREEPLPAPDVLKLQSGAS